MSVNRTFDYSYAADGYTMTGSITGSATFASIFSVDLHCIVHYAVVRSDMDMVLLYSYDSINWKRDFNFKAPKKPSTAIARIKKHERMRCKMSLFKD